MKYSLPPAPSPLALRLSLRPGRSALWPVLLLILVGFLAVPQRAHAQRAWFDGVMEPVYTVCPITGNVVTSSQSYVGYWTDPDEPYPMTGDVGYVHAVGVNVSPCSNDAIGFDFYLPAGAELAIDASTPVYCFRGKLSDGYYESVPNASNSSCSQTPSPGISGGGAYFGYSALPPGWWLEIQVPVRFNQKLLGIAGPDNHKLYAVSHTAFGTVVPEQAATVFYSADFSNLAASGVDESSARLDANLMSYYTSGTAYFDYGTSTSYGQSIVVNGITSDYSGFNIYAELSSLLDNVDYYWRVRYVTADGVFNSGAQTFRTGSNPTVSYELTVNKTGTGDGSVSSSPTGISCGADCSQSYAHNSSVTLTATAVDGSEFTGWTGACAGTSATCVVTMDSSKTVTAAFAAGQGAGSSIGAGSASPANSTVRAGDSDVPLLQFELDPGAEALEVVEFRLRASGTGNDAADIEAVKIYADTNGNGEVEPGETVIAEGSFASDNALLSLTPATPLPVNANTHFLVAYDFSASAAAASLPGRSGDLAEGSGEVPLPLVLGGGLLVLLSALSSALKRRLQVAAALVGLAVVLSACGGAGTSALIGRTYVVTLEEVRVERQSSAGVVLVPGTPVTSATITVR